MASFWRNVFELLIDACPASLELFLIAKSAQTGTDRGLAVRDEDIIVGSRPLREPAPIEGHRIFGPYDVVLICKAILPK
jgi:hypothetical protein